MRGFVFLSLLAFAAGCASPYHDPTLDDSAPAPAARLVLRNQNADLAAFRTFGDSAGCRKPQAIAGASTLAPKEEADIGILAGRDFTFEAKRVAPDACAAIVTFRPEAGAVYLAQFGSSGPACWLNVVRIVSTVPPRVEPEVTLRARRLSADSANAGSRDERCAAE
jgi:hypothetical protein